MNKPIHIIKIGGNIIDNPVALKEFIHIFAQYPSDSKILVHGGGVMAGDMARKLEIPVKMHEGRRITDSQTLQIVTMVYAGWINKTLVDLLEREGCPAIGLSGADANLVPSTRRSVGTIDYGYVGDPIVDKINTPLLHSLLRQGICPILCSITRDSDQGLMNTNADTLAASVAIALSRETQIRLVYCFEKDGVMYNDQYLPIVSKKRYIKLKEEGIVTAGMIPKLDNAFNAMEQGVQQVCIKHALKLNMDQGTFLNL